MAVSSEVGGLNEESTNAVFQRAETSFDRCFRSRAKKIELLNGTVRFLVVVGMDGRAESATVEYSDLGDREAERCMAATLRKLKWPKPVGGRTALARYSAAPFEILDPDVREPVILESDLVSPTISRMSQQIESCKGSVESGFTATLYLDTSGNVITAGVSADKPDGDSAVDCLVELLSSASYASPGSYPGKVTFGL